MTTHEIANRLVAFCSQGEWEKAHNELYAVDARSIEPYATPDFEKEAIGLKAIRAKGKKFDSVVEKVHSIKVSEPLVAGNSIAFVLDLDFTMKGRGRMNSPELCVYQIKNGKIISEEFFV